MTNDMYVQIDLITHRHGTITAGSGQQFVLDAVEPHGRHSVRPDPMELLLIALAECAASSMLSILRKMRQDIITYSIAIQGQRAEQPPRVFTSIVVKHLFAGHNIEQRAVQRAIELTEARYCSVSIMLAKAVTIIHTAQINND